MSILGLYTSSCFFFFKQKTAYEISACLVGSAEIAHIGVDVGQSDGADELDVHIIDGDRFHGRILGDKPFFQLEIAEKAAQIQKVFVHGFWGVALDGLMIDQKIPKDGW